MEDLLDVLRSVTKLEEELIAVQNAHFEELDQLFSGIGLAESVTKSDTAPAKQINNSSVTPQQTKKRPKRLTALNEDESDVSIAASESSQRQSARISNSQLLAAAQETDENEEEEEDKEKEMNTTGSLMPPPPAPVAMPVAAETSMSGRPQRAAKLRSEKNLKEPSLNAKLRRPSNEELIKVKQESEQRASQLHVTVQETPVAIEEPKTVENDAATTTQLRVIVKREKMSVEGTTTSVATLETTTTKTDETTVLSTTTTTTTTANNTTVAKKSRKKKQEPHKPIKVERFSDLDKILPISSRTRQGANSARSPQEPQDPPQRSIYEDAIEATVPPTAGVVNETINVIQQAVCEATFNVPTGDATFQVEPAAEKELSMETARDGSLPKNSSLMTEDDSLVDATKEQSIKQPPIKTHTTIKGLKMQARTHELFNPLLQSPVKMRVEAFENVANAQNNLRPKRVKEVGTSGSNTTPVIGKLPAPALGRFLTPNQNSNAVPLNSAVAKKAPMSACKSTTLMKTATGTNLKSTNSSSTKTLTRENSGDDFRKGLHQLADERKKQRELKHLQAAQQREAKERERAERMAKLAKEREEKRLKKQQEKEKLEERKRLEMEELQRKQYQQEEADRLKKAKAKEQERELLHQMKMQQMSSAKAKHMMPPPPKSKYTFEMLHEDDSTDDEGKVSHKRPPVPNWSRSHVRGAAIAMQSHCPTDVIDSFFSVAPTTPDLKLIFPDIDPSHLKRNSSVLWSTPPRYSELPKY